MFLEVVLDWRAAWFRELWREALDLYMVCAVLLRLLPTEENHAVYFLHLRPPAGAVLQTGRYATFFRWLVLGSRAPNRAQRRA